jgi:hypothetical protein
VILFINFFFLKKIMTDSRVDMNNITFQPNRTKMEWNMVGRMRSVICIFKCLLSDVVVKFIIKFWTSLYIYFILLIILTVI